MPLTDARARRVLGTLAGSSLVLLLLRVYASTHVGYGDAEALYASYALHPQPAYLDHPGLVGAVARAVGAGAVPGPERAHLLTSILSTLVPWLMVAACRLSGATFCRSLGAALIFAWVPEIAVGLFALTPDLLLALAWTSTLALAAAALRSPCGSARAALCFAGAGVLAGVAAASKVTGVTLLAALAIGYATRPARAHARTVAPWAGLCAGAIAFSPVVAFEAAAGWPMLRHRLVETQASAGPSLRNAGALVAGQIVYLSPLVAVLAALAARELWRGRRDAVGALLLASSVAPLAVLAPLCLWSRVAEPHWIGPGLLALTPAAARAELGPPRRLLLWAGGVAAAMVLLVHAWVLVPSLLRLAPASYDPRLDLANELQGWPDVARAVREEAGFASFSASPATLGRPDPDDDDVAVVGPHWVICAQLEAALRGDLPVGCDTPVRDDFDDWWARERWHRAEAIVWVTDTRFGPPPELRTHALARTREVRIERAGRVVRVFSIAVLLRRAVASAAPISPPSSL